MSEPLVNRFLQKVARRTYTFWERLGVHVTPVHFYQPLPDTRLLGPSHWASNTSMEGLDLNEAAQLVLLKEVEKDYGPEYTAFPMNATGEPGSFYINNDMFVSVDAEMLYSMVRRYQPSRVIEAGSGFSSLLIDKALTANEESGADRGEYTIFDPYAGDYVKDGLGGRARLVTTPVETVELKEFAKLEENDILFIDSSHALRTGGDVQFLFLEVLPRLAPGVIVHVHDIFLPQEYPMQWVLGERRYWSEQYILQAFLAFNSSWEVLWAGNYMKTIHPDLLASAFPSHQPGTTPGSFWMRPCRDAKQDRR